MFGRPVCRLHSFLLPAFRFLRAGLFARHHDRAGSRPPGSPCCDACRQRGGRPVKASWKNAIANATMIGTSGMRGACARADRAGRQLGAPAGPRVALQALIFRYFRGCDRATIRENKICTTPLSCGEIVHHLDLGDALANIRCLWGSGFLCHRCSSRTCRGRQCADLELLRSFGTSRSSMRDHHSRDQSCGGGETNSRCRAGGFQYRDNERDGSLTACLRQHLGQFFAAFDQIWPQLRHPYTCVP